MILLFQQINPLKMDPYLIQIMQSKVKADMDATPDGQIDGELSAEQVVALAELDARKAEAELDKTKVEAFDHAQELEKDVKIRLGLGLDTPFEDLPESIQASMVVLYQS